MKQITYYTVIIGKRSVLVKYAASPAYEVKLFSGAFTDPGEASLSFKCAMTGELLPLSEVTFVREVGRLASRYKQDLARLSDWNSGRGIRI